MKIIVNEHKLEIAKEPINEKEINVTRCEFEFADSIPEDYAKKAFFTYKGTTYEELIQNGECDIPYEVLDEKGQVEIGVIAYKVEDEEYIQMFNPSPAYFETWKGSLKEDVENSSDPTPSEIEQIESQLAGKQDILVSGENIKTINNQSILGEGNIHIEGGGGGTSDYEELTNKPQINSIGLIGNKSLDDLGIQAKGNYALKSEIPTVPTNISAFNNDSGYITGYTETDPVFSNSPASGITSSDITAWNGKGTYSKPVDGIPSTDLSSGVQASLGKADTALQSETYTGTITSVKMNGSTVASSGEADLGTVITSHQDISGKQDIIQYSTVPTASADNVGDIIQFTGTTDSTYTNGYFYICTLDNGTYKWENLNVQPSSGGGGSTGVVVNNANYSEATIVSAVNDEYQKFINGQEYNVWWQGNSGGVNTLIPMHFWYNAFYQPYLAGLMPSNYYSSGNAYWLKAVINCYKTGTNVTSLWPNASTLAILKGNDQLLTSGNEYSYNVNKDYIPAHKKYVDEKPTTWSGYDATKTQVLKNINGTLTWVEES